MRRSILVPTLVLASGLVACGGTNDSGPVDATPPAAPTDVVATAGPGYVTVSWTDNSDDETGFVVYRDDGADDSALRTNAETKAGEVAADATEFIDMGVAVGSTPSYRVSAVNEHGESEVATTSEPVSLEPGVDLMVGTNDRRYDDGTGTVFVVYLVFPESVLNDDGVDFDIAIAGPDGWNGGAIHEYSEVAGGFARTGGFDLTSETDVDAVAGTYELTVTIGSDVYTASATLPDAGFKIGPPTEIVVVERSPSEVTVTWNQPIAAQSALVSLWRGDYLEFVAGYEITTESTATIEDLTLEDDQYRIEVAPLNVDVSTYPIKVDSFGISYDSRPFLIGNAVADACASPMETVTIPDAALATAVRDQLGLASDDVTCEDMALLPRLDAVEAGVSSLDGLEYAINLGVLEAAGNDIVDLSPLSGLDQLEWLNLNENLVGDLGPLADLTGLRGVFLCCESNDYDDIAPLASLTNLEALDIGGHGLTDSDVAFLADFIELRRFWAWGNAIGDPILFANLDSLELLNLDGNQIADVAFLEDMAELQILNLNHNPIADLAPLHGRTEIVHLDLAGLSISDIGFLESFTALEGLELADNDIHDVAPLVRNTGLGAGDYVGLARNVLDLSDGSDATVDLEALRDRGVDLDVGEQREP